MYYRRTSGDSNKEISSYSYMHSISHLADRVLVTESSFTPEQLNTKIDRACNKPIRDADCIAQSVLFVDVAYFCSYIVACHPGIVVALLKFHDLQCVTSL